MARLGRPGFGVFVLRQLVIVGAALTLAYIGGAFLLLNLSFILVPIASLLPPPASDPFWIAFMMVYGVANIFVYFVRFNTASPRTIKASHP